MDNILINIWTIIMFQVIKRSDRLNQFFRINTAMPEVQGVESVSEKNSTTSVAVTVITVAMAIGIINFSTDNFLWRVISLSLLGLAFGNFIPRWNHSFVLKAGALLMIIIMAILGLRLDFSGLSLPFAFVVLCVVWLIGHYMFMMLGATLLNVHMAWVPIASMANLGGISTAPAVTSAYNKNWMPHAILLAILSMVTGTMWGIFTMYLFNHFP